MGRIGQIFEQCVGGKGHSNLLSGKGLSYWVTFSFTILLMFFAYRGYSQNSFISVSNGDWTTPANWSCGGCGYYPGQNSNADTVYIRHEIYLVSTSSNTFYSGAINPTVNSISISNNGAGISSLKVGRVITDSNTNSGSNLTGRSVTVNYNVDVSTTSNASNQANLHLFDHGVVTIKGNLTLLRNFDQAAAPRLMVFHYSELFVGTIGGNNKLIYTCDVDTPETNADSYSGSSSNAEIQVCKSSSDNLGNPVITVYGDFVLEQKSNSGSILDMEVASSGVIRINGNYNQNVYENLGGGKIITRFRRNSKLIVTKVNGLYGNAQFSVTDNTSPTSSSNRFYLNGSVSGGAADVSSSSGFVSIDGNCTVTNIAAVSGGVNSNVIRNFGNCVWTVGGNILFNASAPSGVHNENLFEYDQNSVLSLKGNVTNPLQGIFDFQAGGPGTTTGAKLLISGVSGSQVINCNTTSSSYKNIEINRNGLSASITGAIKVDGALTLTSGKLDIGSNSLTLNGDFSGSASNCLTGNGSGSNIIIGGSGSLGTLYFDQSLPGTTNRLLNFTVNRSGQTVTLGNRMEIKGTVTATSGTLNCAGNLVLISNVSGDASIATILGTVTGNAIIQKYIPGGGNRRWLQLGSPVSGFKWDSLKSYIFITGGSGSTGFDANSSGKASANTYDETISGTCAKNGWVYPASPAVGVPTGTGMRVYYRGDRSDPTVLTSNLSATPVATTLNFTGPVHSGTISPAVSCTNTGTGLTDDGWNFIANPYPSAIDWNAASGWSKSANISSQISVWDAGNKRYATWDGTNSVNGGSRYIAMGQGFWIKVTSYSAPSLSMDERVKVSNTPPQFFKMSSAGSAKLRVTYIRDTATKDEALICFDKKWDNTYDSLADCVKLLNEDLSIWSLTSDGKKVVINYRSLPFAGDTIKLNFNTSEGGIHEMQFSDYELLPSNMYPFLIDQYSHKKVNIRDLKEPYRFLVNADTASTSDTRFNIVFVDAASPVQLNVLVSSDSTQAQLKWSSGNELGTQKYEVEYSNDTLSFQAIETVLPSSGPGFDSTYYQLPNVLLANGINYFRIKKVIDNNAPCYSNIQSVEISQNTTSVHSPGLSPVKMLLYPTMASDKITLAFDPSVSFSNGRIDIYSANGGIVKSADLVYSANRIIELSVSGLAPGVYYINVCDRQSIYKAQFIKTSVK